MDLCTELAGYVVRRDDPVRWSSAFVLFTVKVGRVELRCYKTTDVGLQTSVGVSNLLPDQLSLSAFKQRPEMSSSF